MYIPYPCQYLYLLENPALFEGDVMLKKVQWKHVLEDAYEELLEAEGKLNRTRVKRSILRKPDFTWKMPIPYFIETNVDKNLVRTSLQVIMQYTCVTFKEEKVKISNKAGLNIYKGEGCWSYIGRIYEKKPQKVSIGAGCSYQGIIQHEISHALGMEHEQSRPDRDKFLTINAKNIKDGTEAQFTRSSISDVNSFSIAYDYASVMHYDQFAFSSNNQKTMVPKMVEYDSTIGQYRRLSFTDVRLINQYYCQNRCNPKITNCQQNGYQDPKNCKVCRCPWGLEGKLCNVVKKTKFKCGSNELSATTTTKSLIKQGNVDCHFRIKAPMGSLIKINLINVVTQRFLPCWTGQGLSIKFRSTLAVGGAMYCGNYKNKTITTQSNFALIHYPGGSKNFGFQITYHSVKK
uniref:Zinc metalloproteinase n=1 Tax=Rhabditophanes sp. KR3021 TaxID=114890 RepID=A0AC35U5H0_9BILA